MSPSVLDSGWLRAQRIQCLVLAKACSIGLRSGGGGGGGGGGGVSSSSASLAGTIVCEQGGDAHQVVGEHGGPDQEFEARVPSARQRFMPRPRNSTEMRPSMPALKRCPCLKAGALLIGVAMGNSLAAGLRDAHDLDAAALAQRQVTLAVEATIRTVEVGGTAKGLLVALQRAADMLLVRGIAAQHLVLGDQATGALGEKNLVAELHRCLHLAALDQVGVRLEDGVDLLGIGDLLTLENAAAGLVDDAIRQPAIVADLVA